MRTRLLILAALCGLYCGAIYAAVNAMNGVAITTASTIMGKTPNSAVMGQTVTSGGGGYTLLESSITAGGGAWPIGDTATGAHNYAGQLNWSNASARTIGKVAFKLSKTAGSITGKTFTAKLWSLSGTTLSSALATSTGVTGDNAWANTTVEFIFPAPYTTTGATNYAFTIEMSGGFDASNYAEGYNVTPSTIAGELAWWENSLAINSSFSSYDIMIAIYTTP